MASDTEESGEQSRRRREQALRALAQGTATDVASAQDVERQPTQTAAPLEPPPTRRKPRHWLIPAISGVILLAVVAVVITHLLPTPAPKTRQAPAELALDPETYGISCLENAAWSPDSTKLAILGQQQDCGVPMAQSYSYYPTVIVVVDATTGRKLSQFAPDVTIQKDLNLHAPQYITPENGVSGSGDLTQQGAFYSGIAWAPDSSRLAAPFRVTYLTKPMSKSQDNGGTVDIEGLYIADIVDQGAHVLSVNPADLPRFAGEWDVKNGEPVLMPQAPPMDSDLGVSRQLLPTSINYTWQADGSLAGAEPLNTMSAPTRPALGPIGNPDGGASFTIWQPMQITRNQGDPAHPINPAPFVATSFFLAWSPDGTYLLSCYSQWRIQPSKQPIPGPAQLKASFTALLSLLPVRDAALDALLNSQLGSHITYSAYQFAWSPDGKMLSTMSQSADGSITVINILDCASAKTLSSIRLVGTSNAIGNILTGNMLWAPNGKSLLAESGTELYILGPGKLP